MAVIADSDIQDLVKGTLKHLGLMNFTQIATRLQNYEVMGRLLKKDKMILGDGYAIQRNIMLDHSGAAKQVGLFASDTVNIEDVMAQMDVPYRHTTVSYGYERREILFNRGTSRVFDLLKIRRTDAMISMTEHLEDQFWSKPSSSSDNLNWFGVPYWVLKSASTGFTAANPSGFTSGRGNIDSTAAANVRWNNYAAPYTNITKSDLVSKMRTAHRKIKFKSPVDASDYRRKGGLSDTYRIYVNETTLKGLEDIGEAQNESLGRDIASMDGMLTFRKNPIVWVPKLDSDTDDPVYMINLGQMSIVVMKGDYLRETEPAKAPNQHNTWVVFVDLTANVISHDLRCHAVLSTGT